MAKISFSPSHIGICVTDLQASLCFYCEGLGFEMGEGFDIGPEYGNALEVAGDVRCTSKFIRRNGMTIELLHYTSPRVIGQPSQKRNQLGLTHLSFYVEDLEEAASQLIASGGTLLPGTRYDSDDPSEVKIIFLSDPDGTRVELMQAPPTA